MTTPRKTLERSGVAYACRRCCTAAARASVILGLALCPSISLTQLARAEDKTPIGTARAGNTASMPVFLAPSAAAPDNRTRLFLWPSEEEVDPATRLLIGQTRERHSEELRVMAEVMLSQHDKRKYPSTLKEMLLAPLSLKAMLQPDVDIFGVPANCQGKASFSEAYAACSLTW